MAQEFCDAGLIFVNGAKAKSSKEIKANDEIEIKRRTRITKVRVREVPAKKQVSKEHAAELYEILSEEILEEEF